MKLKWKENAVSPVIATILMVAITVVLAAVLYVMVIGMTGDNSTMSLAPAGSWQDMSPNSNNSATITFGNFQPEASPMHIKLLIQDENGHFFNLTWFSAVDTENYTLACSNANITAFYFDFNPDGNLIGGGDHITIYGLEPFTYYYVRVFHYPSDSIVEMAGKKSFQTVP
ncbi:MAG: type IV pilin [Thermoplasmata archaeon]|nr:type IV pilin [Thermoplasmata archaeon]